MKETKVLFYRKYKNRDHTQNHTKYELIEFLCNVPHVLKGFPRLRDLKKFVKSHYDNKNYELKKLRKDAGIVKKPLVEEVEHVYIKLEGKAVRDLSWGMSWNKVARIEQIEGIEAHLKKTENVLGFEVNIHFGFNEWANSGLEYIAYSSPKASFLNAVQEDLTKKYGEGEKIVDFQGLSRMLKKGAFKNDKMLTLFLKKPDSRRFNQFIETNTQLTFRSALKWETDFTVILLYHKLPNSPGERNGINHPYVVEFLPKTLFEFFEESFAQLFIHV
jgi:hypothetical protein